MKICVIGLGYIGLPTSLMFAMHGHHVIGVDTNPRVIEALQRGVVPIEENGISDLLEDVRLRGTFRAQTKPVEADVFIIAVPTPILDNKQADLRYVVAAMESIIPYVRKDNLVIIESTIPPRTTVDIAGSILAQHGYVPGVDIMLAHCPERVLPGRIIQELVENNRIIGGFDEASAHAAAELYRSFVTGEIILTNATAAEMSKLMENTYRDVNIALANELAKVSADIGIDALEVIRLANKHPRVNLHAPGPGVGGHCIAVDPFFVIEKSPVLTPLMQTARQINESMPAYVVEQVHKITGGPDAVVTVFGLTYKGNIDDTRESPAVEVVHLLQQAGYTVQVHDPHVDASRFSACELLSYTDALQGSQCLIVLADHREFRTLDEEALLACMHTPIVFDTKQVVAPMQHSGITHYHYGNLYELHERAGRQQAPLNSVSAFIV